MSWQTLRAHFSIVWAGGTTLKGETAWLALGRRRFCSFLYEPTELTRITLQVFLTILKLCDTIQWYSCIICANRTFLASRNHIVTCLASCLRHIVPTVALTCPCIQVHRLILWSTPTDATTWFHCQELGSTHSTHIGVSTLFASWERLTAKFALILIQIIARFTFSAPILIVTFITSTPFNHLTACAPSSRYKHIPLASDTPRAITFIT